MFEYSFNLERWRNANLVFAPAGRFNGQKSIKRTQEVVFSALLVIISQKRAKYYRAKVVPGRISGTKELLGREIKLFELLRS